MSGNDQMSPTSPGVKLTYDDFVLRTPLLPDLDLPLADVFRE